MSTADKATRDALVVGNMGLAHHMARKFEGAGIEMEDRMSIACIGLIKAADGYDPDRGVRFASYAGVVIRNELLMAVRARRRQIEALSLDAEPAGSGGRTWMELLPASDDVEGAIDRQSAREAVRRALGALRPREARVVSMLHGLDGGAPCRQIDVARAVGVSQSIVSRWNRDARGKLREALAGVV